MNIVTNRTIIRTVIGYIIAFLSFDFISADFCCMSLSFRKKSSSLPVLSPALIKLTATSSKFLSFSKTFEICSPLFTACIASVINFLVALFFVWSSANFKASIILIPELNITAIILVKINISLLGILGLPISTFQFIDLLKPIFFPISFILEIIIFSFFNLNIASSLSIASINPSM